MIIWGTEVTALQAFGYSISLCGIIYYKLGYDAVKKLFVDAGSSVSSLGARKPLLRRASLVAGVLLVVYLLLRSFRPYSPFDRDAMLTSSS